MKTGAEIILRVAMENSINPRLLLALLEYHSHWVYGSPTAQDQIDYPLGLDLPTAKGLYNQLVWAVNQLSIGYYAYREGRLTEIRFSDGVTSPPGARSERRHRRVAVLLCPALRQPALAGGAGLGKRLSRPARLDVWQPLGARPHRRAALTRRD